MYLNLNFNKSKIIVTRHAKERALQRARLLMFPNERDNLDWFLTKDFRSSKIDTKIINCPFYINRQNCLHGRNSFDSKSKLLTYHCRLTDENVIIICTVTLNKGD